MTLQSIDLGLQELWRDPEERHEFFTEITQDEIAAQIRDLRKRRGLVQADFGEKIGMRQSAVSRIEQADHSSWTFKTLMRVARALDARWRITLQPCEEALKEYEEQQAPKDSAFGFRTPTRDLERHTERERIPIPRGLVSGSQDITHDLNAYPNTWLTNTDQLAEQYTLAKQLQNRSPIGN